MFTQHRKVRREMHNVPAMALLTVGLASNWSPAGCDDIPPGGGHDTDDMMDTEEMDSDMTPHPFTVTIENVSDRRPYREVGIFDTPEGDDNPGPALPGKAYAFTFMAGPGERLSFASMFGQSNDLFYAPGEGGLALFDEMDMPVIGDVTDVVHLYNAGTEIDQPIGEGPDQAPRQSGPNTGAPDPDDIVRLADDDAIPPVDAVVRLALTYEDGLFTATLENVSDETTLMLSDGTSAPAPFSPGIFVVHPDGATPIFQLGVPETGTGLEAQAEDGSPAELLDALIDMKGQPTPFSPGVYAIHREETSPLFTIGVPEMGHGLESLAERGDPAGLAEYLDEMTIPHGVFDTPEGADSPGPTLPGSRIRLSFEATPGDMLSFATMFGQSNDLFFAPKDAGIPLFNKHGRPKIQQCNRYLRLFDAGTEVNEPPGIGLNQAPRQSDPDAGLVETMPVGEVDDMYFYPPVNDLMKVTITSP